MQAVGRIRNRGSDEQRFAEQQQLFLTVLLAMGFKDRAAARVAASLTADRTVRVEGESE